MACIKNVLGGHVPSPTSAAGDEQGNQAPRPNVRPQCPSSTLKDDAESWGHPRVSLRPPFTLPTNLSREQLERPSERTGSGIPVDGSRVLRHPHGPPPAVAEETLATAEVNRSEGLAGRRQRGQDSINVSQEFFGGPPAVMIGGTRVSNGGPERRGNNARLYAPLPQGQVFFPPRGPQVRGPPHIPTIRSGIMTELPARNPRMTGRERLAHVSFPLGGPWHPVENWPRPIPFYSSTPGLPPCATAHCFIPAQPPSCNPFLSMPIAFAPPLIFGPPMPSYFANFPPWGMPSSAPSNRENN